MGTVDISALLDPDGPADYDSWKKARPSLITSVGSYLFEHTDPEISRLFESWEPAIKDQLKSGRVKAEMNGLMAFSLVRHFQGSLSQGRYSIDDVKSLYACENRSLIKASIQVLRWLARHLSDARDIFAIPIESASKWLHEKNGTFYFNALYIIKKAKRFSIQPVIPGISANFDLILLSPIRTNSRISAASQSISSHSSPATPPITDTPSSLPTSDSPSCSSNSPRQ
jgi:hypothetical protein